MVPNAGSNFGRTRLTSNGRRLAAAAATLLAVGVLPACGFLHPGKPQPSAAADAFGSTVTRLLHAATAGDASDHDASVDALAALGAPAVPHLAEALKDPDEKIRGTAVETLTKMHGKEVVDALVQALKDQNEDIRAEAARGLGALPDRRAVQPKYAFIITYLPSDCAPNRCCRTKGAVDGMTACGTTRYKRPR